LPQPDLSNATWRKSTYSGQNGNCVEVALNLRGVVAIRDSKCPSLPPLLATREAWASLIEQFHKLTF